MSCCQPTVSGSTGTGGGVPASGGGLLPYVGASAYPATTSGGVVTTIGESKTQPKTTTEQSLSLATCSDCRKRAGMILLFLLVLYAVSRK